MLRTHKLDGGVTLEFFQSIKDVDAAQWDALHSDEDSPFVEHAFLEALEVAKCAAPDAGWQPLHLTFWRDNTLFAAAPAYVKENSEGEFVFDWAWADASMRMGAAYYPKLIVAVPFTPAKGSRLLRLPGVSEAEVAALVTKAARIAMRELGLSSTHVLFPHEEQALALEAQGLAHRIGVQFHWNNEDYKTPEDFLARFQSKKRNALRRERSQPSRDSVRIETVRGDALTPAMAPLIYKLYLTTVDKFTWGRRYLNERFFERALSTWKGRAEWVQAVKPDGTVFAGAFNASRGSRLYGRYWGALEEQPFLHFNVCYYHSIDDAIARGLKVFEPGAGGEHKLVRGFDPTVTHSAHLIEDPRLDRAVRAYLQRETAAINEAVARERADSPLRRK